MQPARSQVVLLTGVSGYVGGRLVKHLEERGIRVRCLARRPGYVAHRVGPQTQIVKGDVLDAASLTAAMQDVDTAYYLVHSMGSPGRFAEQDRLAARNFANAARDAGVRRIIYLGGLGEQVSSHLASRQEVGRILRESGVQTLEFRASVIIGSGSLSFEMIRALVEKLPVMVTPRWVRNRAQPIGIEDVIRYLVAALEFPGEESQTLEIGGSEQASYLDLMREYAQQKGLERLFIPVPLLTPWLSGLWLGLVTPLLARVGRKLIDSIRSSTVVHDESALRLFSIVPMGYRQAIERALVNEELEFAQTRWSDALCAAPSKLRWGGQRFGNRLVDSRTVFVPVNPRQVFVPVRRIGGRTGWYYGNWLWRVRGWLDRVVGGVGLRRGRRDAEHLFPGETVDFWRVDAIEPCRLLRLNAEMRLPGRAVLQFEVDPVPGGSNIRQTAMFEPRGLGGLVYWYALYPIHQLVFAGMLRGIARACQEASNAKPLGHAASWTIT